MRLVAVGFDALGLQSFVDGGFFAGELLLDTEMEAYRGLRLNRLNFVSTLRAAANPKVWKIIKSVTVTSPVPGDFEGDGMQLGATYVVDRGGEVVYAHKQKYYGDIPTEQVLREAVLQCKHLKPQTKKHEKMAQNMMQSSDKNGLNMTQSVCKVTCAKSSAALAESLSAIAQCRISQNFTTTETCFSSQPYSVAQSCDMMKSCDVMKSFGVAQSCDMMQSCCVAQSCEEEDLGVDLNDDAGLMG